MLYMFLLSKHLLISVSDRFFYLLYQIYMGYRFEHQRNKSKLFFHCVLVIGKCEISLPVGPKTALGKDLGLDEP